MGIFNDLLRKRDILLKRILRTVYHNRGKPAVYAGLAYFKILTVVEMEDTVYAGAFHRGADKVEQIFLTGIFTRSRRDLKYDMCLLFGNRLGHSLNYLHIVYIKRPYRILLSIRL